jgi:hypothetical protein
LLQRYGRPVALADIWHAEGIMLGRWAGSKAAEVGKRVPESGWADFYEFSQDGVIRLGYRRLGTFRYTWAGEFLDREAWQEAQLANGDCGSALAMAEHLIKTANGKPPSRAGCQRTAAARSVWTTRALGFAVSII